MPEGKGKEPPSLPECAQEAFAVSSVPLVSKELYAKKTCGLLKLHSFLILEELLFLTKQNQKSPQYLGKQHNRVRTISGLHKL